MLKFQKRFWGISVFLCAAFVMTARAGTLDELTQYMDKWEFGGQWREDKGPHYFVDLIFPVYAPDAGDKLFFLEPRFRYADEELLVNMGTGYRQLVLDNKWLLGTNMFADYETEHAHYRLGWGIEALSSTMEFRANTYLGLSPERDTETTNTTTTREKAVDGFDLEWGVPVPYYSRLKLFGGFNWYNFERFKNRYGWSMRAEYTPYPFVVLDGVISNDTKTNVDWSVTAAVRIPFGEIQEQLQETPLKLDESLFPPSDMSDELGVLVERQHEIVVEKSRETSGVTIEINRGT